MAVRPGKIILGALGDIEAGVRQLIRKTPLETTVIQLATGDQLQVPPLDETIRIKAYLIIARNQWHETVTICKGIADKALEMT